MYVYDAIDALRLYAGSDQKMRKQYGKWLASVLRKELPSWELEKLEKKGVIKMIEAGLYPTKEAWKLANYLYKKYEEEE